MQDFRKTFHRKSIRLKDYDYSQEGAYFITICTNNRYEVLGDIEDGKITLSSIGNIAHDIWLEISGIYSSIETEEFIIMPNHLHGVIVVYKKMESPGRGLINQTPTKWILMQNPSQTLGKIIRRYKAKASYIIHKAGYIDFGWQRNYYEHIIRNDKELNKIREYIINNPAKWDLDRENQKSMNFELDYEIYFRGIFGI
jgi:putative transposase